MLLQTRRRKRLLFLIAGLIAILLLANAVLMYRNSRVIELNRQLQVEVEHAKVNTVAIVRNLHLLDLGIRGYALTKDSALLSSLDSAKVYRDRARQRRGCTPSAGVSTHRPRSIRAVPLHP